jgi:outer membrane murein-binding lipoprotein Lpp
VKKKISVYGVVALIVVGMLVLAGCSSGSGPVGTMGAPSVSNLSVVGTAVGSEAAAGTLFQSMVVAVNGSFSSTVTTADALAFRVALAAKYNGMTPREYWNSKPNGKSIDYSLSINDTSLLALATVTGATIKGSNSSKLSVAGTVADVTAFYYRNGQNLVQGDKYTSSNAATREIYIPAYVVGGNTISGTIKTEFKEETSSEITKTEGATTYERNTVKATEKKLVSAAISFSNGTTGAIFRFSFAEDLSGDGKSIRGQGSFNYSDIEVFTGGSSAAYILPSENFTNSASTLLGLAEQFVYDIYYF